jgi:hypothetical protein
VYSSAASPPIRRQLKHLDAVQAPAMRRGDMMEFLSRFGEGDVQAGFAHSTTFQQKLHRQRSLAGAWLAFD